VADREVDPDPVADDATVALRQLHQLAPHPLDVPCVREVAQSFLLLGKRELEQLHQRQRIDLEEPTSRLRGDPDQARRAQGQQHLVRRRREQHPPRPGVAGDDRTGQCLRRAANRHEALFDDQELDGEKRASEARFARGELERRAGGDDLVGTAAV
jgi:hypothetical protein